MPDPPGYSAVRALLRVLEDKGHLRHEAQGGDLQLTARGRLLCDGVFAEFV